MKKGKKIGEWQFADMMIFPQKSIGKFNAKGCESDCFDYEWCCGKRTCKNVFNNFFFRILVLHIQLR